MNHTNLVSPTPKQLHILRVRIPRILFFLLLSRIIKRDSTPRSLDFKREPHVTDDLLSSKFRTINYQFVKVFIEQSVLEKKVSYEKNFRSSFPLEVQRSRNSIRQSPVNESMTYQEREEGNEKEEIRSLAAEVRWNEILVRVWLTFSLRPTH